MQRYRRFIVAFAVGSWVALVALILGSPWELRPPVGESLGHLQVPDPDVSVPGFPDVDPAGQPAGRPFSITFKVSPEGLPDDFDPWSDATTLDGLPLPDYSVASWQSGSNVGTGRSIVQPLFTRRGTDLFADRQEARTHGLEDVPDLRTWYRLLAPPETSELEFASILFNLVQCPRIQIAYRTPRFEPAVRWDWTATQGDTCPIKTPEYDPLQGYAGPAPGGIDIVAAWERPGGRGDGIQFADIEGAWNVGHEDLPLARMQHVAGEIMPERGWEAHGTAVVGVVASRDNDLGMVGLTPDVDRVLTGSLGGIGAAAAIDQVACHLEPGDVLLIELHGPGPRSRFGGGQKGFVPMEWWAAEYEAIKVATSRGIVVVEAAGNGGENLDDPIYEGKFDRAQRDSGAILVGAGAPFAPGYTDRSRLDFSNHGQRVDVQGWGREVATLDYGDLQRCSEKSRVYTAQFAGTSSASPVVAGAVIALQGIYKARTGGVLSGDRIAKVMIETGSPQVDGPHGPATQHIGPRPDLQRALHVLDMMIKRNQSSLCF